MLEELARVEADRKQLTALIRVLKAAGHSPQLINGVGGSDPVATINALSLNRDRDFNAYEGYPAQILGYGCGCLSDLSPGLSVQRGKPELVAFSLRVVSETHTETRVLTTHQSREEQETYSRKT